MADKGQIEMDAPDRKNLGDIVDSISAHPGLQMTTDEQGNVVNDDSKIASEATAFLKGTIPGSAPSQAPTPSEPAMEAAPADTAQPTQDTGTPPPPAPTRSVEEMEREVRELREKVAQRNQENLALKAVNEHFDQLARALRPPEAPKPPERIPIAFDEQNQPYVDPTVAQRMIDERVQQLVDQRVQESLRPLTSASNAYSRMKREFPEFAQQEGAFGQWLETHTDYRDRIGQNAEEFMEPAYLRYLYENAQATRQQNTQSATAAQAQVTAAQRHAAPAGGAATPQRRTTEIEAHQQQIEAARKFGEETGNWNPYMKVRMMDALGEDYLNTLEKMNWGR